MKERPAAAGRVRAGPEGPGSGDVQGSGRADRKGSGAGDGESPGPGDRESPGAVGRTALEAAIITEITPTQAEEADLAAVARELEAQTDTQLAALGLQGKAAVQGSVAKGTWLKGGADLDLFLLLDPSVPMNELESVAKRVGTSVLEDCRTKYAQHPYVVGTFRGRSVDLVPAYRVAGPSAKMSAVDRTPFHTQWVLAHLTEAQRAQVRLAKRFLKGVGVYGAQTAIGGFSGYLVEVLLSRFVSFAGLLDWLAAEARPRRIALGEDKVEDEVSPLVVVDPVDPARNCAAAVQPMTLDVAIEAARRYLERPARVFFFPNPHVGHSPANLEEALAKADATWTGLIVRPSAQRLDIVFPQFQRAGRTISAALEDAGFAVTRQDVTASPDEQEILFQWVTKGGALPDRRVHRGPAADREPNASKFREKWEAHPDALGKMRTGADGRLEIDVAQRERTPAAWLHRHGPSLSVGKHATKALAEAKALPAPAVAPDAWLARVTDLILDRKPWER